MKKVFPVLLSSTIVYFSITQSVQAQSSDKGSVPAAINHSEFASYPFIGSSVGKDASTSVGWAAAEKDLKAAKASLKALKANTRAAENFKKNYKISSEVIWSYGDEAIVAFFLEDEVQNRIVYDRKGQLVHTLSYYSSNKIPNGIISAAKKIYPDLNATVAIQVKEGGIEFYIVNLEDENRFKQVSIYDGEVNLMSQFTKSR